MINQSENCAQADHIPATPLPHLAFKNAFLKPIGKFRCSERQLPWTPCLVPCNKLGTFLHHNLVSVDWLYCVGERIQVWFSNNTETLQGCTLKSDIEDRYATFLFKDRNFVSNDFKQRLKAQPHT